MPGDERYDVYRMRPRHVVVLFGLFFVPVGGGLLRAYTVLADNDGDLGLALALLAVWLLPGLAVLLRMLRVGTDVGADGIRVRRFWRTRLLAWSDVARIWPDDAMADGPLRGVVPDSAMVVLRDGRWVRLPQVDEGLLLDRGDSLAAAARRLRVAWQRHRGPDRPALWLPERPAPRPRRAWWSRRTTSVGVGGPGEMVSNGLGWATIAIIPALLLWLLVLITDAPVPTWLPIVLVPLAGFVVGVIVSYRRSSR